MRLEFYPDSSESALIHSPPSTSPSKGMWMGENRFGRFCIKLNCLSLQRQWHQVDDSFVMPTGCYLS